MLTRFAILSLLLALSFPACKKHETAREEQPARRARHRRLPPRPSPAAAATPRCHASPVRNRPIDQNAQVVIFGYHRFVNNVRRPDTEITPAGVRSADAGTEEQEYQLSFRMQDFLAWRRGEKAIPAQERHHHLRRWLEIAARGRLADPEEIQLPGYAVYLHGRHPAAVTSAAANR